jgi:hypothetical protein
MRAVSVFHAIHFSEGNLFLRARSNFNVFDVKQVQRFWSTGVLEYWKNLNPNIQPKQFLHFCITALLQLTLMRSKHAKAPSGNSSNPDPFSLDSSL